MATRTKKKKILAKDAAVLSLSTAPALDSVPALKIIPQIIPLSGAHEDLLPPSHGFQPHPGEYHIIALGPGGAELPGSDFSYPPGKSFEKAFASNPKFNVKKKPQP